MRVPIAVPVVLQSVPPGLANVHPPTHPQLKVWSGGGAGAARFSAVQREEQHHSGGAGRGFDPWSGKLPRASEQLGLCAAAAEGCMLRSRAPQREKALQGKPEVCN